jgi:hypothetical protein
VFIFNYLPSFNSNLILFKKVIDNILRSTNPKSARLIPSSIVGLIDLDLLSFLPRLDIDKVGAEVVDYRPLTIK